MLFDTSGLLAIHNEKEPQHTDADEFFRAATWRLTHSYILAEFVALSHSRRLPRELALEFINDTATSRLFEVVWVDHSLHEQALELLFDRLDKTYSLCDAVSFILMREHGIQDALTTDRHFEQEGFHRLLKD